VIKAKKDPAATARPSLLRDDLRFTVLCALGIIVFPFVLHPLGGYSTLATQIAIGAFSLGLGFVALVTIFRFRSFKEVISAGRASREAERAGEGRGPDRSHGDSPHDAPTEPEAAKRRRRVRY